MKKSIPAVLLAVPQDTVINLVNHSQREDLRVPEARYLQLHAACAKIAHASGAADLIDDFFLEYETMKTLSADGSSSELLGQALRLTAFPNEVH